MFRSSHTHNSFSNPPDHFRPWVWCSLGRLLLWGVVGHLCGLTGAEVNQGSLSLPVPHPSVIWSNENIKRIRLLEIDKIGFYKKNSFLFALHIMVHVVKQVR